MVTSFLDGKTREINEVLLSSAETAEPAGAGRWKLALGERRDMSVAVVLEDEWLCFDAPLNGRSPALKQGRSVWALLELNGRLSGGVRFALRPYTRVLSLRADLPLGEEGKLRESIQEICVGLPEAADALSTVGCGSASGRKSGMADWCSSAQVPDLAGFCGEAGWESTPRAGGVSVLLDVPGESHSAFVKNGCGVRAEVPLLDCENLTESSRLAVAVLLLTASWLICLARPTASDDTESGQISAGFEISLGPKPSAGELDWALKTLSVACRLCASEALALQDPDVADAYLAVRDWD